MYYYQFTIEDLINRFESPNCMNILLEKEHRQMRSSDKSMGFDYIQRIETLTSRPIVVKIKQLPRTLLS